MESGQINTSAGIPILTSRLGRPSITAFNYERLDPSVDSIRLLVILPGSENDGLACELVHKTFASKPKYEALSYTWGDASNLKSIHLHGSVVYVRESLYRALLHLRSKTEKRFIWVDAICINQNNVEERSNQVRLMSFIYGRAQGVVVWLGIPMPPLSYDENRYQFMNQNVDILCDHPYWRRIWIIQEISLARNLTISFSDGTFSWAELKIPFSRIKDTTLWKSYGSIEKVLDQRENRHNDKNRLELLLERFSEAQCGEVRDKIYGFVGLAHDCYDGSLKVDYSSSLHDIFADVVKFQSAAKPLEGPFYRSWQENLDADRPARLVRFARLVQRAFDGATDTAAGSRVSQEDTQRLFRARGYIAGTILHLGTSYTEKQWKLSWEKHYTDITDLATLREMDDVYTAKLLEMGETDLAKVRQIHTRSSFGFRKKQSPTYYRKRNKDQEKPENASEPDLPTSRSETGSPSEPRRFLGSSLTFGLVPPAALEGDLICRFWDCDVAVVVRQEGDMDRYNIVGRADVAEIAQKNQKAVSFKIERALAQFDGYVDQEEYGHMDFGLDMEVLQKMTV